MKLKTKGRCRIVFELREIDPTISGPGTWIVIHVLALISDESGTKKDYEFYSLFIYRVVHNFPCSKCRSHAVKYLDKYPIPATKQSGSLFEWSVIFHNVVNKRLKKKIMPLEEAREIYQNTEVVLNNSSTGATCSLQATAKEGSCEDKPL